jgi:hypothetical protein
MLTLNSQSLNSSGDRSEERTTAMLPPPATRREAMRPTHANGEDEFDPPRLLRGQSKGVVVLEAGRLMHITC